jgi:uncharacterized repeat protein (TIGR03803 family)
MSGKIKPRSHTGWFFTIALLVLAFAAAASLHAQKYSVLYNFGDKTADPRNPSYSGILAQGRDGNLYSTAPSGGLNNYGAVFKITPGGTLTVLHNFDSTLGLPQGGLTLGTDGNFYGDASPSTSSYARRAIQNHAAA